MLSYQGQSTKLSTSSLREVAKFVCKVIETKMKGKSLVIIYICILQMEICASITVRTVKDLHTYSEVSEQSTPTNLTCYHSKDTSSSVFLNKLSKFWLVLNTASKNKRHNYLCRHFSNVSELSQQTQRLVMDLRVNETRPVYAEPDICGCVPLAVLMPILAVMVVSIVLNLHFLLHKRHKLKQRIVDELRNFNDDTGSDESLLGNKEVSTVVIPDESGKGDGSCHLTTKNGGKNSLYLHAEKRRRVGSADNPLEDQKTRTDTISRYNIPKIGFDNGSELPPQTSLHGREEDMGEDDNSAFRPVSIRKVPYYPLFDKTSVEINGYSKNGKSINGSVTKADSQLESNVSNQDSQTTPTSNVSRGIGFHLPEPNDEECHRESEGNVAVKTEQEIAGDTVSNLVNREEHDVVTADSKGEETKDKTSDSDEVNSLHEGNKPVKNEPVENEGFQPNMSFAAVEEENVADGDIQRLDNDNEVFLPDMSLSGRNVFQSVDDIPVTSRVKSPRGFHSNTSSHSADLESPRYGIPSFYNDDNEGFQPNMSLKDRENELEDNSTPIIDNFGFQPDFSLHGRGDEPTNDVPKIDNFGFQSELPDVNRERDSLPFEPSLNLRDSDDTSEAVTGGDSKVEEPSLEPLKRRGRSDTIEEYNIPSVPFGGDSIDAPVISASAAAVDRLGSKSEDKRDTSIVFGASADDKDNTLNTDSFA